MVQHPPDALVLVETHRLLAGELLPGYRTERALQAPLSGHGSGGIALALAPRCLVLDTVVSSHFVATALRISPTQRAVLAVVYIPPSRSRFMVTAYSELLDQIAEAVATL